MAQPLLKYQKSALLNKSSESDSAPSAQVLPQHKSSGDQIALQPKASADQNVPQHQKATFEVATRFMEGIVFTKTPWPILPDDKYRTVDAAWKLAIEAQDCQQALAGATPGTPSVSQLPSGPSLKIDSQGQLADGAHQTVVRNYQLDLRLEAESWFASMEVLDHIYHQFFFTANSLGHQPTTSQYFQRLTPQTLLLVDTAIHCALSEYATGKKATVMFSQDEY
jgi:hypothetical protein